MRIALLAAMALPLAACGSVDDAADPPPAANEVAPPRPSASPAPGDAAARWDLQSSGEGVALARLAPDGAAIRLFCPAGARRLIVNVPAFRPIGSEERLSFGSDGEVEALVADTSGDAQRGGVSGAGAVPSNLAVLVAGPLSASYGAQTSGPHPAPPANLARAFVAACGAEQAPAPPADQGSAPPSGACLTQGNERLRVAPLRAIGTEPFWGARIEGRCVTYSHPEDQDGTRVWTRYAATEDGATWTGALGGRPFVLRTRRSPRCSDGMSDEVYPIAVELTVNGERRTGCARPI